MPTYPFQKVPNPLFVLTILELLVSSLSTFCEILDLPNEGDHVYLTSFDKYPVYGKPESDVYLSSRLMVRHPKQPSVSNSISRYLQVDHWRYRLSGWSQRFCPLSLESFSLFPSYRIESHHFRIYVCEYTATTDPNPSPLNKLSLSSGCCHRNLHLLWRSLPFQI